MLERRIEVLAFRLVLEYRNQRSQRALHIADKRKIDRRSASDLLPSNVDLDDLGRFGIELLVREIRSEHKQGVAALHSVISRREADQAGHADVEGIIVLDELFAAHGVNDGRLEPPRTFDKLVIRAGASAPPKVRHPLRSIQHLRALPDQ